MGVVRLRFLIATTLLCAVVGFAPLSCQKNRGVTIKSVPSSSSSSSSSTTTTRLLAATTEIPEGIAKTISKAGDGAAVKLGDIATVKYRCYLPNDDNSLPFAKSERQNMAIGDGQMVPGWDKALCTMTIGERSIFRVIDPELGYGSTGVPPLIPPNAEIEFDIEVIDSRPPVLNIDFDGLASDDKTPRTASEIAAAYEARQAQRALEPKKEGLEGFIEKAKGFYFFGLFEGETGQQAPWFLRPSITFPLAFLIVGAAFYVSYSTGAITERGVNVQDELDEFITTSTTTGINNNYFGLPNSGGGGTTTTIVLSMMFLQSALEQVQNFM